ncbi:MAG TPA: ankyrin repeat domain-containing protein, partial [Bryobacteraceae bacterium]|nr:ankyrin repeat domain-containing protein [Bryobacteraceae bacterium]
MSMYRFVFPVMLLAAVPCLSRAAEQSDLGFEQAIRRNDLASLRKLLKKGDVNAPQKYRTTPLVTAASFGSLEAFQMLLDAGADVNARNDFGLTPLIAAAGDRDKVRLLLAKGADVNARSKLGRTPLMIAAATAGCSDIVELLIAKGADVTAKDGMGTTALVAATDANETASVKLLLAKGADANGANFLGLTPLMAAAGHNNLEVLKLLLARGANVHYTTSQEAIPPVKNGRIMLGSLTALHVAAPYGRPEILQALLDAGATVDAKDIRGMTPLMLAVASDRSHAGSVRLLLAKGADPKVKDIYGATVEDWARRYNRAEILAALSLQQAPIPAGPGAFGPAAGGARAAVEKSVGLLQRTGVRFFQAGGCASCHAQNMAAVAIQAARSRGARIDEKTEAEQTRSVKLFLGSMAAYFIQRGDAPGRVDAGTFPLFQLAADGVAADSTTDPAALNLARQQAADGSWRGEGFARAPFEDSNVTRTAMGIRGLQKFEIPGRRAEFQSRIARAAAWLRTAPVVTTEDLV